MSRTLNQPSKYALWFASLLIVACAGGAADPEPQSGLLTQEQAVSRISCHVTADCSARGGFCTEGLCHADNECATAADCADGSACVHDANFGGLCDSAGDPAPAPTPNVRCAKNGHCPAGQSCGADGTCHPVRHCNIDRDCRRGQVCDAATGRCVPRPPRACRSDSDCLNGAVCDAATGQCVPRPPRACRSDSDCLNGAVCDAVTGQCVAPPCTPLPNGTCK